MSMEGLIETMKAELAEARALVAKLEAAIADWGGDGTGRRLRSVPGGAGKTRKPMSAAGKEKIRAAQKKRWAKVRRDKKAKAAARSRKPKAKVVRKKAAKAVAKKVAAK